MTGGVVLRKLPKGKKVNQETEEKKPYTYDITEKEKFKQMLASGGAAAAALPVRVKKKPQAESTESPSGDNSEKRKRTLSALKKIIDRA
jgi:hypothetical protein